MLFNTQLDFFGTTAINEFKPDLLPDHNNQTTPIIVPEFEKITKALDYRLTGSRILGKNWKDRAKDNIRAIELAISLEQEGRNSTPEEQDILIKYTGFGASELACNLFPVSGNDYKKEWKQTGEKLSSLINKEQREKLMRSTQYAHYTPEYIIHAIWKKLIAFGFKGGKILEPGCGSGLFMACMPNKYTSKAAFTAIENEPLTALIAKKLYPNSRIIQNDFLKTQLNGEFDLVIGNPPFSDRKIQMPELDIHSLSLHEAFLHKSISLLKEGGICVFVISRWFMDKLDHTARASIADQARLIGAIRLPQASMRESSGTDVVVDIVFFQKEKNNTNSEQWMEAVKVDYEDGKEHYSLNKYFLQNPQLVLGQHTIKSAQYGKMAYSCVRGKDEIPLEDAFQETLEKIGKDITFSYLNKSSTKTMDTDEDKFYSSINTRDLFIREGSYLLDKGSLCQIIDNQLVKVKIRKRGEKEGIYQKQAQIIKAYIPIRNAVRAILYAQMQDDPWGKYQTRLMLAWKEFVKSFGPINKTNITVRTSLNNDKEIETRRRPNLVPLLDDPDVWLVSAIEIYDEVENTAKPGAIFTERVISAPTEPEIHSTIDALAIVLDKMGCVNIDQIMTYAKISREKVISDLKGMIYLDHEQTTKEQECWVMADDYLSGYVCDKLKTVREICKTDDRFLENVEALEKAQPEDLKPSEITVRLGAPWLAPEHIKQFFEEVIGVQVSIYHVPMTQSWKVNLNTYKERVELISIWGTERRNAAVLLEDALNSVSPEIYDIIKDSSGEQRIFNSKETEAAKEKMNKIKNAFENWIWQNDERAESLCKTYNRLYNNFVPRSFNGDHLKLPGASDCIQLRPFQKRVIWRIISAGSSYIAHTVGAGKTFSLCAAIMEQKRLGLVKKPIMVVPSHCLAQAAREFLMLYPLARILVADENNFEKSKRQRFISRMATDNWDCIIITHSAFKFIPVPVDFEQDMIREEIQIIEQTLQDIDNTEDSNNFTRKEIEKRKEKLEGILDNLSTHIQRDDLLHLGETGIDQIIVDEAHLFRKLSFETRQRRLRGVDPNGSQRAWDLYVKSKYIACFQPDRSLILASGSPITNTMGEMFTIMRFMIPEMLKERKLNSFDAWAGNFGETKTELELQPNGIYKPVTRFASFVNVADLMSMYRSFADIVVREDLRSHIHLPALKEKGRQIVVCPSGEPFKLFQQTLADRLKEIEARPGKPQKGDDIILNVINDGRHGAIDLRLISTEYENEEDNKLNKLIKNVFQIWQETTSYRYINPVTKENSPITGATQMIFSDLGTEASLARKGFSAYSWIRSELIRMGVPEYEIAFMQNYKKTTEKQKLFADLNEGRKRILIGSTATMGTGVNAQQRLIALHHLDVPWLVADIEQREGRIERQGNQNQEISIFAYALLGSTDTTNWQLLERKARFIALAMSGDKTIRRMEDVGETAGQFALAKALTSGDTRLIQKFGLEADIARLQRLKLAWKDNMLAIRSRIKKAQSIIETAQKRIPNLQKDLKLRIKTEGECFYMETANGNITNRTQAGNYLLGLIHNLKREETNRQFVIAKIGGFKIAIRSSFEGAVIDLFLLVTESKISIEHQSISALGLIIKIERLILHLDTVLIKQQEQLEKASQQLIGYEKQKNQPFLNQNELEQKEQQLIKLVIELENKKEQLENQKVA